MYYTRGTYSGVILVKLCIFTCKNIRFNHSNEQQSELPTQPIAIGEEPKRIVRKSTVRQPR